MVIQAHMEKVRHISSSSGKSDKAKRRLSPSSGPRRACPVLESWQATVQLPRETPATEGGREGISLADISAAVPRLQAFPRHSGATALPKVGLEARAPQDRWQPPAMGSGLHIKRVAGAV